MDWPSPTARWQRWRSSCERPTVGRRPQAFGCPSRVSADREGATTLVTCQVSGGPDDTQARAVAREVVRSTLVKAAVHGRDPNWGRIAAAAGNATVHGAPVPVEMDRLAIGIAGVRVFDGEPIEFDRAALSRAMAAPEVLL